MSLKSSCGGGCPGLGAGGLDAFSSLKTPCRKASTAVSSPSPLKMALLKTSEISAAGSTLSAPRMMTMRSPTLPVTENSPSGVVPTAKFLFASPLLTLSSSGDANKNFAVGTTPLGEFSVTGKVGDRIVIMRGADNVDPAAEISLVFNKAIFSGDGDETAVDAFLHGVFKLEKASKPPAPKPGQPPPQLDFRDINDVVTYRVDSG